VASPPDPRRATALLGAWLAAAFALSAVSDLRVLALAAATAALAFRRGILRPARRVLRAVVPATAALSAASFAWVLLATGRVPAAAPFVALAGRSVVIAFVGFAVLERIDLFRAVAPWPTVQRLLVVTLAQIHAVRLLATESRLGLRSRMVRTPGTLDVLRSAGGVTGALFTLAARNARDVTDAMISRGF
jgi:cobalt/nickel transport system permease protein